MFYAHKPYRTCTWHSHANQSTVSKVPSRGSFQQQTPGKMGHRNTVHMTSESNPLDTAQMQNKFGHSEVTFFGNGRPQERPASWKFTLKNHVAEFSRTDGRCLWNSNPGRCRFSASLPTSTCRCIHGCWPWRIPCRLRVKCFLMAKTRCFHQQSQETIFFFSSILYQFFCTPHWRTNIPNYQNSTKTCPFSLYEE